MQFKVFRGDLKEGRKRLLLTPGESIIIVHMQIENFGDKDILIEFDQDYVLATSPDSENHIRVKK